MMRAEGKNIPERRCLSGGEVVRKVDIGDL
jgi:hypothetical protein